MNGTIRITIRREDREAAEALCADLVDGSAVPQALIAERVLRHPKASFVYSVEF